jgi:hypothetical protein
MLSTRLAASIVLSCLPVGTHVLYAGQATTSPSSDPAPTTSPAADDALFRVFLTDGSSLVSYGELARVDDRVVFSMPTSASREQPQLHLVTLAADRVDWDRTTRYADSARATRYIGTRAERDYAELTDTVAQALNDVSHTQDASSRLRIVERARKTLADWPPKHFNHKQHEVRQMLGMLDEAIADLRASAGLSRFDLSFVAATDAPDIREPLMPAPTPREAIEQTLLAAGLTDSSIERVSLLATALTSLDRDAAILDTDWTSRKRVTTTAWIDTELAIDRRYQGLTQKYLAQAEQRARVADVRGIHRLLGALPADDITLGQKRPEAMLALVAAVQAQLDAAQRLRLARDRWLLKSDEYRKYSAAVDLQLARLQGLKPALEDIKSLVGSTPAALSAIETVAARILRAVSLVLAPEDLRAAHALLISAAQLADSAARIRREAVLSTDLARAWDASSAAAGSLMLAARARGEIESMLKPPLAAR